MSIPTAMIIGSVSHDVFVSGSPTPEPERATGGVVHHAGCALARLGARTRVVTRASPADEDLLEPLRAAGVAVHLEPCDRTTRCANDYSGEVDRHELLATSEPIRPDHVPASWRSADLVQLGPLHPRDLEAETVRVVSGFRGLDIQGLVRAPAGPGLVSPDLGPFLEGIEVVKASEEELVAALAGRSVSAFVRRYRIPELLITRGARGVTVVVDGDAKEVATLRVARGSTVGAGDVFLASFLWLRVRGQGPLEAARGAASIVASKIRAGDVPRAGGQALLRVGTPR